MTETAATGHPGAVIFTLGGGRYAIPMPAVAEVGRMPRLTRVPGVPGWLLGVANWRGRILPVGDIRSLLDPATTPAQRTAAGRLVVLGHAGVSLGLVADTVEGIVEQPGPIEPPPMTLTGPAADLVSGQLTDTRGPIGLIEPTALIALREHIPRRTA